MGVRLNTCKYRLTRVYYKLFLSASTWRTKSTQYRSSQCSKWPYIYEHVEVNVEVRLFITCVSSLDVPSYINISLKYIYVSLPENIP